MGLENIKWLRELTPEEQKVLDAFQAKMQNEVIPEIEQIVFERRQLAAINRAANIPLYSPAYSVYQA